MKTTLSVTSFVTLIAALSGGGCGHSTAPKTAAGQGGPTAVVHVTASKPQRKTLVSKTTQPARIEAFEQTPLFSKLAGYVEKVHADIGDKVSRDQPLLTLREPELADDVQQKSALVAQAEAQLKQAAATVDAAQAAVETADAKVAEADAGATRQQ